MLALAIPAISASPAAAQEPGSGAETPPAGARVVIAVLPFGTTVEEIAAEPELAPGLVSAGLGPVPVAQTFLDVSQGNRVNEDLYDRELPRLYIREGGVPPRLWERTVERADGVPAQVEPGLLGSTLASAGIAATAEAASGQATLIVVDGDGRARVVDDRACGFGCGPGLSVMRTRLAELPALVDHLAAGDLLIALAAGQRADQELLPVGIAGAGFAGNLSSASTRTDGVVTTTDLTATVLARFGVDAPEAVNGSEISSGDERDPAAVAELQQRLDSRPSRELVVLLPLGVWLLLALLATLRWRGRGARPALRLMGLAIAWAPLLLLAAAAPDANTLVSGLLVGLGSVVLALLTDRLLPGPAGLALACAVTVGAYAVDVVAGSPLTAFSVLGPNPGFGVRFFGIGNELEAVLTTMTLIGTGAGLAVAPAISRRAAAAWFVAVAALATAAFAPGRFGADVGAAIVLGVGGATAAVLALGLRRGRAIVAVIAGGVLALAALLVIDLALGGAHLSRSVLDAGEPGELADVFERRLILMSNTFIHPVYPQLLVITAALLVAGFFRRRTVLSWFGPGWAARSGFGGALAGVLVGTVANDSGSVLLVIGTIYLSLTAGFFWAWQGSVATITACASPSSRPIPGPIRGA